MARHTPRWRAKRVLQNIVQQSSHVEPARPAILRSLNCENDTNYWVRRQMPLARSLQNVFPAPSSRRVEAYVADCGDMLGSLPVIVEGSKIPRNVIVHKQVQRGLSGGKSKLETTKRTDSELEHFGMLPCNVGKTAPWSFTFFLFPA